MSFSHSSREISLGPDQKTLLAKCCKLDGTEASSSINLDSCLGNDDGKFVPGKQRFSKTARVIRLNGVILTAKLARKDGE